MKKLLFVLFFLFPSILIAQERWAVTIVPVADVRSVSGTFLTALVNDPKQETQLIYGEKVKIVSESGDWYRIEAVEQQEFSHHKKWEGYPGWIQKNVVREVKKNPKFNFIVKNSKVSLFFISNPILEKMDSGIRRNDKKNLDNDILELKQEIVIPIGSKLFGYEKIENGGFRNILDVMGQGKWIAEQDIKSLRPHPNEFEARKIIIETAEKFLGCPYLWGGRSHCILQSGGQITGVDCSGLTNLSYRVAGMDIPRDSYEQFLKSKRIKRAKLKMGDLIFTASKENPEKIGHVAIFIDSLTIIEAPQTGDKVRKISFAEKFGVSLDQVENGDAAGDRVIYFGSYFEN